MTAFSLLPIISVYQQQAEIAPPNVDRPTQVRVNSSQSIVAIVRGLE